MLILIFNKLGGRWKSYVARPTEEQIDTLPGIEPSLMMAQRILDMLREMGATLPQQRAALAVAGHLVRERLFAPVLSGE